MFNSIKIMSLLFLMIIPSLDNAKELNNSESSNSQITSEQKEDTEKKLEDSKNRIVGVVVDDITGDPLPGTNVLIKGTTIGTAADIDGEFSLPKMPSGTYTLVVKFVGYESLEEVVEIKTKSIYVEIRLKPMAIEGEVVTITAQAKGQVDAINQQINSNTIKNIVSSDRLNEIPDANAAESIGRLPGVAIKRDGGEASEVVIRGLGDGYTAVTIDGVKMTATSEDRGVGIANISPNMLDAIELAKALTPDMDGDATAGAINFKLKQAPAEFKMSVLMQGGYNGYDNTFGMPKMDINFSNRFFDNKLGVFTQASFFRANRGTDAFTGIYETYGDPTEAEPIVDLQVMNVNFSKRIETRDRYGLSFVTDYSIPNGKLLFKTFASRMVSERYNIGNNYGVDIMEMRPNISSNGGSITDAIMTSLQGDHYLFGGSLDWSVNYSYSISNTPNAWSLGPDLVQKNMDPEVVLHGNNLRGPENIPSYLMNHNADIMAIRYSNHTSNETKAGEISSMVNMEIPYVINNWVSGKVKFGGKYSKNDRSRFDTEQIGFLNSPTSKIDFLKEKYPYLQWDDNYIMYSTFIDPTYDSEDFLAGDYQIYFPIDIEFTEKFMTDVKKYSTDLLRGRDDNYENTEQYYAGYLMTELDVTNQLTFLAGVRYEKTSNAYDLYDTWYKVFGVDTPLEEQGVRTPVYSYETRVNWLPMFHIKYKPVNWINVRFAATKTLKRPSYLNLSPKMYVDQGKNRGYFGNTKLKVQEAQNFDLHVSFFNNYIGLLTLGGYYKQINNLIYYKSITAYTDEEAKEYSPYLIRGASVRSYDNVSGYNTWVKGLEFEWQTRFWYLPFPLDGLVLNINYSFGESETILPQFYNEIDDTSNFPYIIYTRGYRETKQRIPGQIKHLANMSIGYDYKDFSIRVSGLYQGPTVGTERYAVNNRITKELLRWDIKVTQKLFDHLQIILDFNNVTNWPDRRITEYHEYELNHERYGWQGALGVRYSL